MKKNFLLVAFIALVLSFVLSSCYTNRRYYERDPYYKHHRHYHDRDYGYRKY